MVSNEPQLVSILLVIGTDGTPIDKCCICPTCEKLAMSINLAKTAYYCYNCGSLYTPNRCIVQQ